MTRWNGLLAVFTALALGQTAWGQSAFPGEFIEASSPLKSGGSVTSRVTPGDGLRTWFSGEPARIADSRPSGSAVAVQPDAVPPTAPTTPVVVQAGPIPTPNGSAVGQVQPLAGAGVPVVDPFQYGSAAASQPTLGITPQSSLRPWLRGGGFGSATATLPPPAASLPPQLPGAGPSIQYPQVIPPATTTGNGRYQPLLPLRNMPPGTWLGQGMFGQPKAYVDGQPVRNLFRYMFLW